MGRRKKVTPSENHIDPSAHWVVSEEWKVNGRNLVKGTEISIRGERGRFLFVRHVYNPKIDISWVDVVGGPRGIRQMRSFLPERIKTVHWKNKIRKPKPKGKAVE
jgi:hypothetical protein